jgi:hypothetical protein
MKKILVGLFYISLTIAAFAMFNTSQWEASSGAEESVLKQGHTDTGPCCDPNGGGDRAITSEHPAANPPTPGPCCGPDDGGGHAIVSEHPAANSPTPGPCCGPGDAGDKPVSSEGPAAGPSTPKQK